MFPEVIKQALSKYPPGAATLLLDLSQLTPASICLILRGVAIAFRNASI